MAIFEYTGLNRKGKNTKGIIDASSSEAAREKLRSMGVYLENLKEIHKKSKKPGLSFKLFTKRTQVASITRQLSFLLAASLPVVPALEGVAEQNQDPEIKKMMIEIKEKVREGKSLSEAFSTYPEYFNQIYISTIRAGEMAGKLDQVMARLAEMYEKNLQLLGKIRSSLTYPALMLIFSLLVIVFLISFLVPTFSRLFSEFGQVLPVPTRILIALSGFISSWWWLFLFILILSALVLRKYYHTEKGKKSVDSFVLRLPVVKNLLIHTFIIRFCYTMNLMLANGVGIVEALQNTEKMFNNTIFKNIISEAIERVKKGEKLSRALGGNPIFTSPVLGMINAGEAGDRVAEVLASIGQGTERDMEERVKTLTSLIEPVVILGIGILVGFVVLAIILPIFQLNQIF